MMDRPLAVLALPIAFAVVAATGLASAATVAFAGGAPAGAQLVAGTRMSAVADRVAAGVVTDPDRSIAPAFAVADQVVPLGAVAIAAETPQVNPTYITVPLQITVGGRIVRTVVVGYRVQQYVRTAVAAHDLAPGAVLTADDLTLARVPFEGRPGVDLGSLVGRRVRAATSRGAQLFVEQTSIVELVKSGSGVIFIVRDGPVALTADVIARTGGGLGDTVTVYNARTSKILSGTVVGPNRVELLLPGENE